MSKRYTCDVTLALVGPLLTGATGPEAYGLDQAFHRDYRGRPVIPGTHIRGRLRMALEELATHAEQPIDVLGWFGKPASEDAEAANSYEPAPGMLKFSDFGFPDLQEVEPKAPEPGARKQGPSPRRARAAIDPISLTAAEHQLRVAEELFASGKRIPCRGTVTFYATDDAAARRIARTLRLGFTWLTSLGGDKGVGHGRLIEVQIGKPTPPEPVVSPTLTAQALHLRIRPLEPLSVGGVRKPRSNYLATEKVLSGGLVKGALAAALNRAHGQPAHRPLLRGDAEEYPGYEELVAHFDALRVSHAFPTYAGQPRPVRMPLSAVTRGDGHADVALSEGFCPLVDGQAPVYGIDWKSPLEYIGAAEPEMVFVTRTAIDDLSRRAAANQLYTVAHVCPIDKDKQPVEWVCNVDFSAIEDDAVRAQVRDQFARAVAEHLDRLGKHGSTVEAAVGDDYAPTAEASYEAIHEGRILVALQTDALMLDPAAVRELPLGEDLHKLYRDFWAEMSKVDEKPCLGLVDFYAQQTFKGGYLYHRYLGAGERASKPSNYHPYYLTGAGSVFVLRALDEAGARRCLEHWLAHGLDLPAWAKAKYEQYGRALWQNCPFVPQNGYGEIVVNLKWHWEKRL